MALYKTEYARDAVQVNGQFIEDLIPGHFYTLTSTGRETLTKEIVNNEYKRNGTIREYSRYPERVIHVEYIISGDTAEDFRNNCNQLMSLLDVENADVIFNDEIDKFFRGTISVGEIEEKYGTWALGSYDIICEDPFKYSTTVYEAVPTISGNEATFSINYDGTQPSRPVLHAEFGTGVSSGDYTDDDDCGFIAFMDAKENIIQLGNPDAMNLDSSAKAGILYSANFDNISASDFTNKWTNGAGGGITLRTMNDTDFNRGTGWNHKLLAPTFSSSIQTENGPQYTLTADSNFQNFQCNYVARLYSTNPESQRGYVYLGVYSTDNKFTGISIYKTDSSDTVVVGYWVDNVIRGSARMSFSKYNDNFGWTKKTPVYKQVANKKYNNTVWYPKGTNEFITYTRVVSGYEYSNVNGNICIQKRGNSYYFKVGNLAAFNFTYTRADGTSIAFDRLRIDFRRINGIQNNYYDAGIQSIRCYSLPGDHFTDQKNVFQAGDIIEADCGSANIQIYGVNSIEGKAAPEYGALGNDWEQFVLEPGTNTIKAVWSDWVTNAPTVKIKYNKVYI